MKQNEKDISIRIRVYIEKLNKGFKMKKFQLFTRLDGQAPVRINSVIFNTFREAQNELRLYLQSDARDRYDIQFPNGKDENYTKFNCYRFDNVCYFIDEVRLMETEALQVAIQ